MDHPRPWLRYVEAGDLDTPTAGLDFDGMRVHGADGEHLGKVEGFVVDSANGRPYYVAVDAGGWFKSKLFLLPIGHVAFDRGQNRLTADLTKDRVHRFPGFAPDEFEKLGDDDLNRMDEQIVTACCPAQMGGQTLSSMSRDRYEQWAHYSEPTWWESSFFRPDRAEKSIRDMAGVASDTGVRKNGH